MSCAKRKACLAARPEVDRSKFSGGRAPRTGGDAPTERAAEPHISVGHSPHSAVLALVHPPNQDSSKDPHARVPRALCSSYLRRAQCNSIFKVRHVAMDGQGNFFLRYRLRFWDSLSLLSSN